MSHFEIVVRGPMCPRKVQLIAAIEQIALLHFPTIGSLWQQGNTDTIVLRNEEPATTALSPAVAKHRSLEDLICSIGELPEGLDETGDELVKRIIEAVGNGEAGYSEPLENIRRELELKEQREHATESVEASDPLSEHPSVLVKKALEELVPKPVREASARMKKYREDTATEATSFEELTRAGGGQIEPPKEMPKPSGNLFPHLALLSPGSLGSEQAGLLASLLDFDLEDVVIRPTAPPEFHLTIDSKNPTHGAALTEIFSVGDLTLIHYVTNTTGDIISAQHLTDISLCDIAQHEKLKVVLYATGRREDTSREAAELALEHKRR